MLQPLINDFLSLIYPNQCPACQNLLFGHESWLCNACLLSLPQLSAHSQRQQQLANSFKGRIPLEAVSAYYLFEKNSRVQAVLHSIKYRHHAPLAVFLGEKYAAQLEQEGFFKGIDFIIPVPLHQKRLKQRGFNQSERLAKGISNYTGIAIENNSLIRSQESKTQTRQQQYARWENVASIFELTPNALARLEGKHVLVIDDVITTGATLEAAYEPLSKIPNLRISIAALAYALKT